MGNGGSLRRAAPAQARGEAGDVSHSSTYPRQQSRPTAPDNNLAQHVLYGDRILLSGAGILRRTEMSKLLLGGSVGENSVVS